MFVVVLFVCLLRSGFGLCACLCLLLLSLLLLLMLFSCVFLLFVFFQSVVRYNLCCFALLCFALRCLALFLSVLLCPLLCKGAVGDVTEAENQNQKV